MSQPPRQKPDVSAYMKPGLKLGQVQSLKQCFDIFDEDNSGIISISELKSAIISLGMGEESDKILRIVGQFTDTKQLDFGTFIDIFGYSGDLKNQNTLQQIFQVFDADKKGSFTVQDLARVCQQAGQHYSQAQMKQMISAADDDKDGALTFKQFVQVVTKEYSKV